jgi:hypothetical protein
MPYLRPHAVKLADAWSIPDWLLDSALGRSDGKVYEDLYDRAHRKNPLNRIMGVRRVFWGVETVEESCWLSCEEGKVSVEERVSLMFLR